MPALPASMTNLNRSELESGPRIRKNGTLSIMPSGLENQLSPEELADLLVFLMSARQETVQPLFTCSGQPDYPSSSAETEFKSHYRGHRTSACRLSR